MHRGYIKIWRKISDSGLFQLHGAFVMFVYMLTEATHKPTRFGTVDLQRGQLCTGRHKLAAAIGLTEQKARTCLDHLHELEMITSESTNKYTIYTIVNYNNYQGFELEQPADQPTDNQQVTNKQPTDNQQVTTIQTHKHINTKEHKKESTAEYSAEFLQAWSEYPRRSGENKKEAFKAWGARLKAGVLPEKMIDGARRYCAYCKTQGTEDRFIKQAVTFFGVSEHFNSQWNCASPPAKGATRVQEARLDFMEQLFGGQNGNDRQIRDVTDSRTVEGYGTCIPEIGNGFREPDGD